jgi:hypothetical protein
MWKIAHLFGIMQLEKFEYVEQIETPHNGETFVVSPFVYNVKEILMDI